jgi:hypothetical protein
VQRDFVSGAKMDYPVETEPSNVSVKDGQVLVHWQDGSVTVLPPDVAVIMSDRLLRAGLIAKRHEVQGEEAESPFKA